MALSFIMGFLFFLLLTGVSYASGSVYHGEKKYLVKSANLHCHCNYGDGVYGEPDDGYKTGKDNGLDVLAITEHGLHLHVDTINPDRDEWKKLEKTAIDVSNSDNFKFFAALYGFEWTVDKGAHINVIGSSNFCTAMPLTVGRTLLNSTAVGADVSTVLSVSDLFVILGELDLGELKLSDLKEQLAEFNGKFILFAGLGLGGYLVNKVVANRHSVDNQIKSRLSNKIKEIIRKNIEYLKANNALNVRNLVGFIKYKFFRDKLPGNVSTRVITLNSFYEWCHNNRSGDYGKEIICQFNHPVTYIKHGKDPYNGFVLPDTAIADKVIDLFALFEVSANGDIKGLFDSVTAGTPLFTGSGDGVNPEKSNEFWFRVALSRGWRCAPVSNEDNHYNNIGRTGYRTMVLVDGSLAYRDYRDKFASITEALRNRRVYVSEGDRGLKFSFSALFDGETDDGHFMGETVNKADVFSNSGEFDVKVELQSLNKLGFLNLYVIRKFDGNAVDFNNFDEIELSEIPHCYYKGNHRIKLENPENVMAVYLKLIRDNHKNAITAPIFFV